MLVNFETESINLKELKKNEESVLLVEGDVIVPDVNPDIGKLLLTDAVCCITNKEYAGGKINISGNVSVNILYSPEHLEEDQPKIKSINTKLDFYDNFAFSDENPLISVKADIISLNCTLLNSRKVNVKITIKLCTKVYTKNELTFLKASQEQAETKKQMLSVHTTSVDTQKEFVFTETLEVPSAKCDIEEILKTNVNIAKGECRIAEEKILLKGNVNINTLYTGFEDGFVVNNMEHELPFSEILDVEGLFEDQICNVTYNIKNVSAALQNDSNGDPREILFSVTIVACINASKIYDTEILEDIYFPGKICDIKSEQKNLKKSVWEGQNRTSFKNICTLPEGRKGISRILSVTSHPVVKECIQEENRLVLKGLLEVFLLYCELEGDLNSHTCQFEFEHTADIDALAKNLNCEYDISVIGTNFNICSENEVEIRTNTEIFIRLTEDFSINNIIECNVSDISDDISMLPQLIIYFVQKGDTLWDIAKHYNTTIKRIKDANHIDTIASPGEKLLIPTR